MFITSPCHQCQALAAGWKGPWQQSSGWLAGMGAEEQTGRVQVRQHLQLLLHLQLPLVFPPVQPPRRAIKSSTTGLRRVWKLAMISTTPIYLVM